MVIDMFHVYDFSSIFEGNGENLRCYILTEIAKSVRTIYKFDAGTIDRTDVEAQNV